MKFVDAALIALTSAHRLSVDDAIQSNFIPSHSQFQTNRMLDARYTTPGTYEVREIRAFYQSKYELYKDGKQIAYQSRNGNSGLGSNIVVDGEVVLRNRVSRNASPTTNDKVYMTSPKDKKVYYTFTQVTSWGQSKGGVMAALGGNKTGGNWGEEVFVADYGWCDGPGAHCGTVAAYARCDKAAMGAKLRWQIMGPGPMVQVAAHGCTIFGSDNEAIGQMIKTGVRSFRSTTGVLSKLDSYSLQLDKPNQDGLMLNLFAAFIDLANNREQHSNNRWG